MFVSRHDFEAISNYLMNYLSLVMAILSYDVIQMNPTLCSSGSVSRVCHVLGLVEETH